MFWPVVCAVAFVASRGRGVEAAENHSPVPPLSIPPSQFWDGVDGLWSTFQIQVGNPGQAVRLLPGTSASPGTSTWVVLPQGCSLANPGLASCRHLRGYTFSPNASTSWSTERLSNGGLYELITYEENMLGLDGNAYYGFDTIHLGFPGVGLPSLHHQLIAGIATNDFWLGSLGLSPIPFNFTNFNDPIPSLLSSLLKQQFIPSISWGYTAGASYHEPPVFGSLTLGGYDTSRFDSSKMLSNLTFGADISRDLVVELRSITYNTLGSSPLLAETIYVFIDSMVTHLWLPVEVCRAFEQAFDLTWNATAQLYLISDEVHQALVRQNPTFTVKLGNSADNLDITLPYAAFDLTITQPLVDHTSRYFPLKQAHNSTQYTLGRVFLQEAYIIADYARQNFSVAQARHPSTSVSQELVGILPPGFEVQNTSASGLSIGVIVGIAVAGIVGIMLIANIVGMVIWLLRRKRRQKPLQNDAYTAIPKPAEAKEEAHDEPYAYQTELDARGNERYELDRNERMAEMAASGRPKAFASVRRHELGSSEVAAVELEGTPVR